jgi:hypothetical protein
VDNWPDQKIKNHAVFYIEQRSIEPATWRFTLIGAAHPEVSERVVMQEGELPLVSCFLSEASWYFFTTRRILGIYGGQRFELTPTEILEYHPGNFKAYGLGETLVMRLALSGGSDMQLEYETGIASMAPIQCIQFWKLKYPVLDKLRFDPRGQSFCPQCGEPLRTTEAQQCFHCGTDWHGTPSVEN